MKRGAALAFAGLLTATVGCDLATKRVARSVLADASYAFAADALRFELTFNPGGFLSLGARLPEALRELFFLGFVPVSLALLCALFLRTGASRVALLGLGLVAGGGLANWLDRLFNGGAVTDFVSVGVGPLRTGIFNVADVAVMAGAALLLLAGREAPAPNAADRGAPPP